MLIRIALIVGLVFSLAGSLRSQIFSGAARTEFFGGLGVRMLYDRVNKTNLFVDGEKVEGAASPQVFVNAVPVSLVYGVLPKLSLIGIVPTISRKFQPPADAAARTDAGIGDISVFAKYRFYKKDAFLRSRQFAVQVGVRLPTGADDLVDDHGNRLAQPLQLGSGAVDYRALFAYTEAIKRFVFTGDIAYDLRTEANDFEFGDVLRYDVVAKYRLHPSRYGDSFPTHDFFILLELNGVSMQRAKSAGREIANSGGQQLFLSPGFQFLFLENMLLEAGVQIPVVQDLNGSQLGTDFHIRTGLRWFILK